MNSRRVSICMPVYNGGNYFKKALQSALAQDYENTEIIVVNDGSTDGGLTESIALEFGDRIRYIRQSNRGVAGALNTAIENATGDYFAWLSHDDIHFAHKTSAQISFLEKLGRPNACLFSDYDLIDPEDKLIVTIRLPIDGIRTTPCLPLLNGLINGCSLLVPMDTLRRFGPFDETLRYTQDYDLWNKILADQEFFHQPEVLLQYRVHPEQDSQKQKVAPESDPLWVRMISDRTPTQRAQLYGSSFQYYSKLSEFLNQTPMTKTADYCGALASQALSSTLVSVIIPFLNEIPLLHRAIESVRAQENANFEIILVDDGSTDDSGSISALVASDSRIRLLRQTNQGAAAARNHALLYARGEYIAFLDADDAFLPNKLARQVQLMQKHGALFSHTSYYVKFPEIEQGLGIWRSGSFSGNCYPAIIGSCPIAVPTVMIHRAIVDEGFVFPAEYRVSEDVLAWIDLAVKYLMLGIDEPLSIVEWSHGSAALSPEKQADGLFQAITSLERHPLHSRYLSEIAKMRSAAAQIAAEWRDSGYLFGELGNLTKGLVQAAWATTAEVPPIAIGRTPAFKLEKS